MKLSFEQIKSVTQGAIYISKENGKFTFHRFNKEEEEYYANTNHEKKAFSSAGIQMVFKTDADSLSIKATISNGSSRSFFSFDIYVDGELCGEFKNFEHKDMTLPYVAIECRSGDFSWELPLKKGEKTLRIVFPFSVQPIISDFVLKNATYIEPVKRSKTMLMYGDSITHGYDSLNPSRAYAVQLSHELDAEAFNKAIGGEIFRPALSAIKNDISPDYITVAYGTNDWSGFSQEELETNCWGFYKNLKENYPDAKIFAITPIWRGDFEGVRKFPFFGVYETISKVCEKIGGVTVIDGFNFIPHNNELYADLRLHPSNEGFDHYAKNLYAEIKKYIWGKFMNEYIKSFLEERFVSDVGFTKCTDTPFPGLENTVSLVFHLSDAVVDQIDDAPTHTYFQHYRTMNAYMDSVMHQLVMALQHKGYNAAAIPASQSIEGLQGLFSHKKAAVCAGLGYIGKSCLFISHKYGPRVRLGTVFTDAPLETVYKEQHSLCGDCTLCKDSCKAMAIKGVEYKEGMCREDIYDAKACSDYMKDKFKHIGRGAVCGVCMKVCPKGCKR